MKHWMVPLLAAQLTLSAPSQAQTPQTEPQIDFERFVELAVEVAPLREQRLLEREAFMAMAREEGVLLLDARSADAFEAGHIEGAVNLPFSDFTSEKLRAVIGEDSDRPILIYCNNNFLENAFPIPLKSAPLALNIPTFINLVGYGYPNVWELKGVMLAGDVPWVGTQPLPQIGTSSAL